MVKLHEYVTDAEKKIALQKIKKIGQQAGKASKKFIDALPADVKIYILDGIKEHNDKK